MASKTKRANPSRSRVKVSPGALEPAEVEVLDRWFRAANYLSVGQIYLLDNALLERPLRPEDVKPRLLGHWGTTPGLNFIYAHLNRVIRRDDTDMIYIAGPGHGGPAMVANAWLEGTYSHYYPDVSQDRPGMAKLFKQFSFPGGIPSHVAPETPGSIHEGGELGYSLSHAFGAAFDNPDLVVAAVVGDGEAETGPLATSWHGTKFLNPVTDGAVLPILHLNGYKIANPTVLARIPHEELTALLVGSGWKPHFVEGTDPERMHHLMALTLDTAMSEIAEIQRAAREEGKTSQSPVADDRPAQPEGLDRPGGGRRQAGGGHVAQPSGAAAEHPDRPPTRCACSSSGCAPTAREQLFDETGRPQADLLELAPVGDKRMSAQPHANGGRLLRQLRLPDWMDYCVAVAEPATATPRTDAGARWLPARRDGHEPRCRELPDLRPRRDRVQPADRRAGGDRQDLGGRETPGRDGTPAQP